ncbi:MAG: lytic transglycosylase [Sphingomonadales bacterium 12-68-11]|nr:MAG: lytic transglycosylase [Sphingomonadales bacterium 12-68-11]
MSSMVRKTLIAALLASSLSLSVAAQEAEEWDRARANLVASQPGPMAATIARWQQLSGSAAFSFNDYAGFLVAYPGFPDEDRLRGYAEARLRSEFVAPEQVLAFFERYPPVSNFARAQYAVALMGRDPERAAALAREAWRGGQMSDVSASLILTNYGGSFSQDDHGARMDALLWQRDRAAAERQMPLASPARAAVFAARLAILQGGDGASGDPAARSDPGYLFNRSRELRQKGRTQEAVSLLANRPPLAALPLDAEAWVIEQLAVARLASAQSAEAIAIRIDEAFAPGADISAMSFAIRDNYTSLMWLAGTRALWEAGDGATAAQLFYRYGTAARTPQTRSKGLFWAGRAAVRGGDAVAAARYYEMAAQYADRFYGQLALHELGRPMPVFAEAPAVQPTPEERARFNAAPLTAAVSEVARDAPWAVGIRFYRAMAQQARTPGEHVLVAELARSLGRRDLAVNLSDYAGEDGHQGFTRIGFPTMTPPPGANWTFVHAISRQESQFAQNAISHAGARGLMQLMPGTAREEAGKAGITYMQASLIENPGYNVQLGNAYFERQYARYGSYVMAAAAYNAGPGRVNQWLAANGDPRNGSVDWLDWIERIPISETRTYVQRVMENAAVYEALHPQQAPYGRPRTLRELLR